MIERLTSINVLISKIVRDLGLGDKEIRHQDFIEWIQEGLLFIGSYYQFKEREGFVMVHDYKGVLPCDLHKPIRYLDGCDFGTKYDNEQYWSFVNKCVQATGIQSTDPIKVVDPYSYQKLQLATYGKTSLWRAFGTNIKRATNLMDGGRTFSGDELSYQVNHDVITTNFRYGMISMRYLAIPLDEQGYPLVPDDVAFFEALMWRVKAKLAMRKNNYEEFEACNFYWNKYCMQARGRANQPDIELTQRLANIYHTLIPNRLSMYNDFNTLGDPEITNFNGRR